MDIDTWTDSIVFQFFQWHFNLKESKHANDIHRHKCLKKPPGCPAPLGATANVANLPAGCLTNCTIWSPRATNLFCFYGFSNVMSVLKLAGVGKVCNLSYAKSKLWPIFQTPNPGMTLCLLAVAQTGFEEPSQKPEQRRPWPMNLLLPSHLPS